MYVVELEFGTGEIDEQRLALRPEHRRTLSRLHEAGKVALAGPWADEHGSMIVYDVADETELRALLAEDPYISAPGVTVKRIAAWNVIVGP